MTSLVFGLLLLFFAFWVVIAITTSYFVGMWKVFVKSGKEGWEGLIPYYNVFKIIEIVGRSKWWFGPFLLSAILYFIQMFIGFVGQLLFRGTLADVFVVLVIIATAISRIAWIPLSIDLAKVFGKNWLFGLGTAIFPFIFLMILGFGSATYVGPRFPNDGSAST